SRLIVLLNDNEMSIAPAVGALSRYLARIKGAQSYHHLKEEIGDALESVPGIGGSLRRAAKSVKDAIAAAVLPGALVNELGFKYIGYVDGHNVPMLVRALEEAKKVDDGPVIVHAITTKGKGFPNPEKNYYAYHATGPFDPKTGLPYKSNKVAPPTYTEVFGRTMCELMAKDEKIIALTAAMPDGTGVDKVLEKFPERAFDVGIAEQHAITFCAGMACEGLKPVAAIYSTFLQRAFDQVIHDVCLQDLNVTFAMDRAGIVGADGPTHHGLLDISYLRGYPNIVLMAPKDEAEMRDMMLTAIDHPGPAAIRYPRGNGFGADISAEPKHIEIGKAEVLREGNSGIVILAYGSMVYPSVEAAAILANEGIDATVVNARFVKPLDEETILALAADNQAIVTVEEAYLAGGFGSAVMELLEQHNMLEDLSVHRMGVSDEIVTHGDPKILLARYGLDADGIAKRVREVVGGIKKQSNRSTLLKAVK
ncbi:MAG TPA: 1-deoxy-D-xylulose-5-phosphate synthase, partial [Pyrinomonadaceae bacterium]|nr:1-deoxy-D-xylulose-5-phosphate synthase [Pyrinomonadaceae bacterium]